MLAASVSSVVGWEKVSDVSKIELKVQHDQGIE